MNFTPQYDQMDCGPACLSMVASHYGKYFGLQYLREKSFITREGVSLLGISEAAEDIGFKTIAAKIKAEDFDRNFLPCILHWNQNHFVVLYKIRKCFFTGKKKFKIADPAYGRISLSEKKFENSWISDAKKGVVLFLETTEEFYKQTPPLENKISIRHLLNYIKPYKKQIAYLFFFLLFGSITTLVFPILTQKLIDEGVNKKNLSVILYVLLAQLSFFLGNIVFSVFQNWITLFVSTRINVRIISDFLKKLLKLPIKFFDTKLIGDFNQRIQDHERVEQFLTSQSLSTLFAVITSSVFLCVFLYYDFKILFIYVVLTAISIIWSLFWMKKRKILDYFRFQQKSESQDSIYEIIRGVSEMKLNQFEEFKKKQWENIQEKLFKINTRILKLDQIQLSGFEFFNQLKNISIIFLSSYIVVQGKMTLGALLSVSYIIGQLNSPIGQLIIFFRSFQDAKLSLSRMNEVQCYPEEELENQLPLANRNVENKGKRGIYLKNVSFQYEGPNSPYALKDINLFIPEGKITAIVGDSGSGKTTLMKLLLKFYPPTNGEIYFNHLNITEISSLDLRKNCGVVMQEGFIFSDTIERNIATGDEKIDYNKLNNSLIVANIKSFVDKLPLGLRTKIGSSGNGISGGQKQRFLIARSVYKNPDFIFFDEATSSLDAENEKVIHDNLQTFFKGKTVLIIAHRLSTVKNSDQIIVLKNGVIIEQGKHNELVQNRSCYYHLVKNQLELGS